MALRFPAEVAARRRANALEQQGRFLRFEERFTAAADAYDVAGDAWEVAGHHTRATRAHELATGLRRHGGELLTVKVLFRKYPTSRGGDVIAVLPQTMSQYDAAVTYWDPMSGHGYAPYRGLLAASRPATSLEYAPVLVAMRRIGYDPIVVQRFSPRQARRPET